MAHLYLDNNVALGLVDFLLADDHTADWARKAGLTAARDYEQLLAAWERGAVLVTHNRKDFVELHGAWYEWPRRWTLRGPEHPGIVIPDQRDELVYGPPLVAFLATVPPMVGQLYTWRQNTDAWQRWEIGAGWRPYP